MGGHLKELARRLTETDLVALKSLLDAGRLSPPYTTDSLLQLFPKAKAMAVATDLNSLVMKGATPALLAELLAVVHAERIAALREDEILELVWTGPEAPDSPLRDTSVVVRELFRTAHQKVIVAGFAVHGGKRLFSELAKRMEEIPALEVALFLNVHRAPGDTSAPESILIRFADDFKKRQWPMKRLPKVYYDPRSLELRDEARASMHAKCIVIDDIKAFVSSANFTEAAQRKNVEAGILVNSRRFAQKLGSQFEALAIKEQFRPLPGL